MKKAFSLATIFFALSGLTITAQGQGGPVCSVTASLTIACTETVKLMTNSQSELRDRISCMRLCLHPSFEKHAGFLT